MTHTHTRARARTHRYQLIWFELYREQLGRPRWTLGELQLGGGTPTFLDAAELDTLLGGLLQHCELAAGASLATEADPRTTNSAQLQTLRRYGFTRLSLGVQCLDPRVQDIINRVQTLAELRAVTDAATVLAMQAAVETVSVDPAISRYCVDLTAATRTHPHVLMGASPRGALALLLTSRAFAVIAGRDYVTPEDVKAVAPAVLAHRITVRPELWMSNASGSSVAAAVLTAVPTPSPGGAGPTA